MVCESCVLQGCEKVLQSRSFIPKPQPPIILIVGIAPGQVEVVRGEVFTGKSGELLEKVLKEFNLIPHVIMTNAIKCLPKVKEGEWWKFPGIKCDALLQEEIRKINPDFIVAMGEAAVYYLVGRKEKRVALGRIVEIEILVEDQDGVVRKKKVPMLATYNPALLLRRMDSKSQELFKNHLLKVKEWVEDYKRGKRELSSSIIDLVANLVVTENHNEAFEEFLHTAELIRENGKAGWVIDIEVGDLSNIPFADRGVSPTADVILLGIGNKEYYQAFAFITNFGGKIEKVGDLGEMKAFRDFLRDPRFIKIMHNASFEIVWFLRKLGVYPPPEQLIDTMVLAHLLNENRPSYSLEALARAYDILKDIDFDFTHWKEWVQEQKENYVNIETPTLVAYNFGDVLVTAHLAGRLLDEYRKIPEKFKKLQWFARHVAPRICIVVGHCTTFGIPASQHAREEVLQELETQKIQLEMELRREAPEVNNFLSTPQLAAFLLRKGVTEIENFKTDKGNYSLTKQVIEKLVEMRPDVEFLKTLLAYRETIKGISTFVSKLADHIHPLTGRIYPNMHITGTKTGRITTSNPPLQNYPSEKTKLGKVIRKIFAAPEGYVLITCDAKQHELRVLALWSGDPNLRAAFLSGKDVHSYNASLILKKPVEDITPEERKIGKQLSFATIYGVSPQGAVEIFGLSSIEEAEALLDSIRNAFPIAQGYIESKRKEILQPPHWVSSQLGRVRRPIAEATVGISKLKEGDPALERLMRQAGNFPIQADASDLWCLIAYNVIEKFHKLGWAQGLTPHANVCLLIHDSMYIACKEELLDEVIEIIKGAIAKVSYEYIGDEELPITAEYAVYKSLGDEPLRGGEFSIEEIRQAIKERLWEKEGYTCVETCAAEDNELPTEFRSGLPSAMSQGSLF